IDPVQVEPPTRATDSTGSLEMLNEANRAEHPLQQEPKKAEKKVSAKKDLRTSAPDEGQTNKATDLNSNAKSGLNAVYVQASPVNGYPHLYAYFSRELKYPEEAKKDSIGGEVIAVFTISADGSPEKIVIEYSLGPAFDREVIRLITNMPPWSPATYNEKPVASKMSLPLTFQIKKITSQQ
ncbi:MAG TPA: energy transducer TonB, partial [Chryseosolibacter sp.]